MSVKLDLPIIQQQIDYLAKQLKQSDLLKSPSDLKMTATDFEKKLASALHLGIVNFNRSGVRRPPLKFHF